ncbi:maleylpyruvate isomerase N-terminal domain-containing protein [Kitasatospora sp. McL0602]|uniref:maleylpyruvate isomerase N-terminal domain-containing protein n=1 Tax=Kitasatospora sp. McL0602 TaxID=3439530 RepID=UPI003F8A5CE7
MTARADQAGVDGARAGAGAGVDQALAELLRVLTPHTQADWSVKAGSLEWSCHETATHIAHDLLAYAGQLAGGAAAAYLPFDLAVAPGATPGEVLQVVTACGRLLSAAIAAADPSDRAWHWGPCDPAGFEAMGIAEILLHTYDVTQGLGIAWQPPDGLSRAVLDRLFPGAPSGGAPQVLLWSTGRAELPGRSRGTSWTWQAAVQG